MSRLRTFIAIDVGQQIRDRLIALQENLARSGSDVKWVEPDNLHLTMLFLGEVDERDLLKVCRSVSDVTKTMPAFPLTVRGVGCFPNVRRPRVVWAGVGQGAEEVIALHDGMEPALLELGCYRREERDYTPHITLGRVRSDPGQDLLDALTKKQNYPAGDTVVREVHVMSSQLSSSGPEYMVLSRAKMA